MWLTMESEPEVIVINLRKTWTLGPVLGLLDRLMEACCPYWHESVLNTVYNRAIGVIESTSETQIGQFLSRVLRPPESPS